MPEGYFRGGSSSDACTEVVIDGQNCVHCPAVEGVEPVEGYTEVERLLGWNASAYSTLAIEGNCYVRFVRPEGTAVAVGLANERISDHPYDLPYAFYFYKGLSVPLGSSYFAESYIVMEGGMTATAQTPCAAGDVFRIERNASRISYFVNGVRVRTASRPSYGALRVVACLYDAGDTVF